MELRANARRKQPNRMPNINFNLKTKQKISERRRCVCVHEAKMTQSSTRPPAWRANRFLNARRRPECISTQLYPIHRACTRPNWWEHFSPAVQFVRRHHDTKKEKIVQWILHFFADTKSAARPPSPASEEFFPFLIQISFLCFGILSAGIFRLHSLRCKNIASNAVLSVGT